MKKKYLIIKIVLVLFIIVNGIILSSNLIQIATCTEQVLGTPLYADKLYINTYDVKVTYMYKYNGFNYMGEYYENLENIERMKDSQITVWVNKDNPQKSIINKKKNMSIFHSVNVVLGVAGMFILKFCGKRRRNSDGL